VVGDREATSKKKMWNKYEMDKSKHKIKKREDRMSERRNKEKEEAGKATKLSIR
jgi:hypothetical protein